MDRNKNYYSILGITKTATEKDIKKAYYNNAKLFHPDKSKKESDSLIFSEMTEAYDILMNSDTKTEYDLKSKWGNNYNEYYDFFDVDFDFSYQNEKDRLEKFKRNEVYNIQIEIDEKKFNGSLEYERWVKCKTCDGTGKDSSSKIVIKDKDGNVVKTFDGEDGCDFCEGTGKDYRGDNCNFCSGNGRIGLSQCKDCNGEKRILGKQKLNGIKLTGHETKIDSMGHFSKDGKVGYLLLTNK
jgi:DnaJ-class molecular chaperone